MFAHIKMIAYICFTKSQTLTKKVMTVQYKGYIIAAETEPWAIKYGINYVVYPEAQQGPDESTKGFATIAECEAHIDEIIEDETFLFNL